MNNLDDMLANAVPKPKRQISDNFTQTVVAEIKARPKAAGTAHWLPGFWRPRRLSKVSAIAIATVVVLGGTAAAASLWPRPSVTPGTSTTLQNGNRIVGVNAKDCRYYGTADTKQTGEQLFYEVRKEAQLSDQQLASTLQGVCEENISDKAISDIIHTLPKDLPGVQSTGAFTINAITLDSITISPDSHYGPTMTTKPNQTFKRFDTDLVVQDKNDKASYGDLKAGDTIKMIVQDTTASPSQTSPRLDSPLNRPNDIKVLAILRIPALTGNPNSFYEAISKDLVRVDRCTSDPSGFCRAYDFHN